MSRRVVDAPAKINLGLEILGKRSDGFHEVRTILCTVSLCDTLDFEPTTASSDEVTFVPDTASVPDDQNLALRALDFARAARADIAPQHLILRKRIPAAAGLGGASSDAAATLIAFKDELAKAGANPHDIAASLGSDVPFFLDGPVALATGRGERLTPLPAPDPDTWAVLVTPSVHIPDKTRTMYSAVDPSTWSTGAHVSAIADRLPRLPSEAPFNVFEKALLNRFPETSAVRSRCIAAGFPFVALSGAGPAFYTLVEAEDDARAMSRRVESTDLHVQIARLAWTARRGTWDEAARVRG